MKVETIGSVTLYKGDCLEILPTLAEHSIDCLLCDPPYGIDYQSARRSNTDRKPKIANDKKPFTDFIKHIPRLLKPTSCAFVFTRWDVQQVFIDEMEHCGMKVRNVLIWDKCAHSMGDLQRAYGSRYESIIFASGEDFEFPNGRPQDIITAPRVPAEKMVHPNEKPLLLLYKLIEQTTQMGGVVLDCFMGSGVTMQACVESKRNGIGIELDGKYYDLSVKRIKERYKQPTLF